MRIFGSILLIIFLSCSKQKSEIDPTQILETLRFVNSFSQAVILSTYTFLKIHEFLDLCTSEDGKNLKIDCVFDFRQEKNVKAYGNCEKYPGDILTIKLEKCSVEIKSQNIYAKIEGNAQISDLQALLDVKITILNPTIKSFDIISTMSQIVLIESEAIRYFRIKDGNGKSDQSSIYISEYFVRDDGTGNLGIKFSDTDIRISGCINQEIKISSDDFVSFSQNCPHNGIIITGDKKIAISGGKITYGSKEATCQKIPACPFF